VKNNYEIKCLNCGKHLPLNYKYWKCIKCNGPLEVNIQKLNIDKNKLSKRAFNLWRYREAIPLNGKIRVTLGEGGTPLIEKEIEKHKVYFKLEYLNPTGSFKDRGASIAVNRAILLKAKRIVEDSSGNAGTAISAYSSAARIPSKIYVPKNAPKNKKNLIKAFGGYIIETKNRETAAKRAISELGEDDYYIGHSWNPFFIEGIKTTAYEIIEQKNWQPPDKIIIPVGNGTLLIGLFKGFKEMLTLGWINKIPKIIAVQAEGYTPLYEAIYNKKNRKKKSKLADAIKITNPPRLNQMIKAIKETNGEVIAVTDEEIITGLRKLLKIGLLVEPTSATAFSAFLKMKENIDTDEKICIILTGSGMKMINEIIKLTTVKNEK